MDSKWTLLEYRPGRYVKVTPQGRFIGQANEAEVRTWFAAQGIELEPCPASEPLAPPSGPRSAVDEVLIWGPKPRPERRRDVDETPPESSRPQTELEPQPDAVQEPTLAPPSEPLLEQAGEPDAGLKPEALAEEPSSASELPAPLPPSSPRSAVDEVLIWGRASQREAPRDVNETPPVPSRPLPKPEIPPLQLEKPPLEPRPSPTQLEQPVLVVQSQLPLDQAEPSATVPAVAPLHKRTEEPGPFPESQAPPGQTEELLPQPAPEIPAGEAEMPPVEEEPGLPDERIEVASSEPQLEASPDALPEPPPEPRAEFITETEVAPLPDEIEIPVPEPEPEPDSLPEDVKEAAPVRLAPQVAPSEARDLPPHPASDEEVQPAALSQTPSPPDEPFASDDALDHWLWVDPRHESGYSAATFDLVAFLGRATAVFQAKPWARGQKPGRVMVHPDQLADGLLEVANDLNLDVATDPTVTAGTFRLALSEEQIS